MLPFLSAGYPLQGKIGGNSVRIEDTRNISLGHLDAPRDPRTQGTKIITRSSAAQLQPRSEKNDCEVNFELVGVSDQKETNAGVAKIDGRSGGYMSRWPLISGFVIALSLGLGACSSSSDGLLSQVNLAGEASETCDSGRGAPTGIAALTGSQAAFAQCMQNHLAAGAGYDEEEGQFAPGSLPTSLFSTGD